MFLIVPRESVNNLDPNLSHDVPSKKWMEMESKGEQERHETSVEQALIS